MSVMRIFANKASLPRGFFFLELDFVLADPALLSKRE